MNHTPTPWYINAEVPHVIDSDLLQGIAGACGANIWRAEEASNEQDCANAARIVACVNAMDGIEDPKKLRETWDVVKHLHLDDYHNLKEKYDELKEKYDLLHAVYVEGVTR